MTATSIVIVGTGGSGRETYTLLKDIERHSPGTWDFKGFLGIDAPADDLLGRLNESFLGNPHNITVNIPDASNWAYALGIGNPQHRRAMDALLTNQGLRPATLIHPTTLIGPDVDIADGAVICANCVITTNVRIGTSAQINIGCIIAHDARIGAYITLAQRVNIAGNVSIGGDATIYTGASILPKIQIGEQAVIGAGAVVTHDVAPQTTVAGVPAKPLV